MSIDATTLIETLPTVEILETYTVSYLPKLVSSILLLLVGFKSLPFFDNKLENFFERVDYDESLEKFLQSLFRISFKIAIIISAISIAGIETTSIIAILGAAGFAVGLALQGSMSNFASGILILTLKPIKVNEYIEVSGITGTVNKIDIFNTILLTPDNKMVIVPNSDITSKILTNYSRKGVRRLDILIGIDYNSDIKKAKTVLEKSVNKHSEIVISNTKRETVIAVDELAASSINMSVLVWCETQNYMTLKRALLEDIKTDLEKANIGIPFPTITISK
jgi:small conductance mechanosensitive channel